MTMPIGTIISELKNIVPPTEQGKDALVAAEKRLTQLAQLIGAVSQYNAAKRSHERTHQYMHTLLAEFGTV